MTKPNILFFLGSGISIPSGLPSVDEISKKILRGKYFYGKKNSKLLFGDSKAELDESEPVTRIQQFLCLLLSLDQHYLKSIAPYPAGLQYNYSGAIYRSSTSYEDLFYLAQQVTDSGHGLLDDAQTGVFIDRIEKKAGNLLSGNEKAARIYDLTKLAERTCNFIEWVVASALHPKKIIGLDLIPELILSNLTHRTDIVTLNHDLLIEQILLQNNIRFEDGFGEKDGDLRWFDRSTFNRDETTTRLIKPHGSVNWYSIYFNGFHTKALVSRTDPSLCVNSNGERLKGWFNRPDFLSGTSKVVAYNRGVFAEMFFQFHRSLNETRFIVMSGYGWGDTAINFRLHDWLERNQFNKILLLHKNPEELIGRSMLLQEHYDGWVKAGRLILISKWLCETSLSEITNRLSIQ